MCNNQVFIICINMYIEIFGLGHNYSPTLPELFTPLTKDRKTRIHENRRHSVSLHSGFPNPSSMSRLIGKTSNLDRQEEIRIINIVLHSCFATAIREFPSIPDLLVVKFRSRFICVRRAVTDTAVHTIIPTPTSVAV
jgi:hypothetical protein